MRELLGPITVNHKVIYIPANACSRFATGKAHEKKAQETVRQLSGMTRIVSVFLKSPVRSTVQICFSWLTSEKYDQNESHIGFQKFFFDKAGSGIFFLYSKCRSLAVIKDICYP